MAIVDVAAFLGPYPYRHLPHSSEWLLRQMDRLGIDRAWVGYLPSFLYVDPAPGNRALESLVAPWRDRLVPVPTVNPEQAEWQHDLNYALAIGAPAVRLYPQYQGIEAAGPEMRVATAAAATAGLPVVLTARFEDIRQRHPMDVVDELPAAAVRALVKGDPDLRVLVTHADAAFVGEVHFGLARDESSRLLWEISWIWGPPEDHLARLLRTVGPDRFVLGTGMPLRIGDAAVAKLELSADSRQVHDAVAAGNLERWLQTSPSPPQDVSGA